MKEQRYVRTRAGSFIADAVLKGITISGLLGNEARFPLLKSLPSAIFNNGTAFMEAHNTNSAWVGPDNR
jgi:hypothetical protein